jgi:DNA-binding beta-propeller fold protein YncE
MRRPGINGARLLSFRVGVITMLSSMVLVVSGGWSPARAAGPSLWIATTAQSGVTGSVGGPVELQPAQLKKSGAPTQVAITNGDELADTAGIVFKGGNAWVTTLDNTLLEFTAAQLHQLSKQPQPTPAKTITSTSFMFIISCLLDAHGNLWIVDAQADGVHEISAAQLASGVTPVTPAVTITDTTDLASPAFAAFDKAGNLWVSSEGNSQIVEFVKSQLASGGALTPTVIISGTGLNDPGQMAFDSGGNLWVTNSGNSTVVEFTKADLMSTGSPTPAVVISDDGSGSLSIPWGLQFDLAHRLWVFNYVTGTISKFAPSQLKASGSPTPQVILTGLPLYSAQLTFGPNYK